jgi:hypothetical protein
MCGPNISKRSVTKSQKSRSHPEAAQEQIPHARAPRANNTPDMRPEKI